MSKNISDLREHLFDALQKVKDGSMPIDTAKAVNEISKTIIDSARVEVEFLETTGQTESKFLTEKKAEELPDGITAIRRHRLAD